MNGGDALEQPGSDTESGPWLLELSSLLWRQPVRPERDDIRDWGSWSGIPPRIRLLDDGRKAQLLAPLSYVRPDRSEWPVPEGAMVDGASIPRAFWSLIGGPFEGHYRNASIVHDHYCDVRTRPWRDTHRMFYEAMRCSGTPGALAKILYYAVYRFARRWEATADELRQPTRTIDIADGPVVVADAEAILVHDLDLSEIEALADARDAQVAEAVESQAGAESPGAEAAPIDDVRLLVIPGGSGTGEDVAAVLGSALNLPADVVARFKREGIRIVACRESVTDFERILRGVVPRGWEGLGRTWDDVPGTYLHHQRRVIIATRGHGGARVVPRRESGSHGSCDLVLHECLHGFDYVGGHAVLNDAAFLSARAVDVPRLGAYERQTGRAGLEETYAESGARFVAEPARMRTDWPALFNFWSREAPAVEEWLSGPAEEIPEEESIGTLTLAPDGRLNLDLRADGPGAVGHATISVGPGDEGYERLRSLVGQEGLGEAAGETVLLPPLSR